MSHFALLVVGDNIEAQMAPFQEYGSGDVDRKFLVFIDTEDEGRNSYETESVEMVYTEQPNTVLRCPWDEAFRVPGSFGIGSGSHADPPGSRRVEIPFRVLFPTLEEYRRDWCGEERDPETGRFGYWTNPNAKWDYWRIGGRWRGKLPVRPGLGSLGELAWEHTFDGASHQDEAGTADQARVCELDPQRTFSAFAVLKDGQWYEKGRMGWWGIVTDGMEDAEWERRFSELIGSLAPQTMLTILDCHI